MRLDPALIRLALRVDADRLAAEVSALPEGAWRAHPGGAAGNAAVPLVAVAGDPADDATLGAMAPTPALDLLPGVRAVLAGLDVPVGRTRLMRVAGQGHLDRHVDTNRYWQDHLRVHIPVVSDPGVRFTCGDEEAHLAPGEVWVFDTWRRHGVANPGGADRIHLVADTVGSSGLWSAIDTGRRLGRHGPADGPVLGTGEPGPLRLEAAGPPAFASPWHQQALIEDLLADLDPQPVAQVLADLTAFAADWHAAAAEHPPGDARRRAGVVLAEGLRRALGGWPPARLPNGTDLAAAVDQLLVVPTLAVAGAADGAGSPASAPAARSAAAGSRLDRPVFIVSSPRAGSTLLFEALGRAAGVHTIGMEGHEVFESVPGLHPNDRGWTSNALAAADATPERVSRIEEALVARAVDRDGRGPAGTAPFRLIEKTPRNALRVPFLAAAFPDATFVYLHRHALATTSSMLEAWRSGRFATYPQLPGWRGAPWSLLLVPGWRDLVGRPLPEIAARQWATTTTVLLDDLADLDPGRWTTVSHEALVADPDGVARRLCARLDLVWDRPVLGPLPPSRTTLDAPAEGKWRRNAAVLDPLRPVLAEPAARAEAVLAAPPAPALPPAPRPSSPAAAEGPGDFTSVHTASVPALLAEAGCSVVVTTYQSGRVLVLRADGEGRLNTHLKAFPRPMGVAVAPGRLALGTDQVVWRFRDQPSLAARLPDAAHDACFVPGAGHVTGDISGHELAWAADGELWVVNTRFSCLATLDDRHSFVPRWRPPFVTALVPEDRCHLNGLAMVDGRPGFVTVLGMADDRQGWRRDKVGGGLVIDVASGGVVAHGLTMPHSPRWHDGRLWVLDSGHGHLSTIDVATGAVEPVVRLPGFTRGLAFVGPYALVGLSQVREHVFAGLPLAEHGDERRCGVWAVDTRTGEVAGFLRFEGEVEEVFDVQVLPGLRYPELLEPGDPLAAGAFVLPEADLAEVGGSPDVT